MNHAVTSALSKWDARKPGEKTLSPPDFFRKVAGNSTNYDADMRAFCSALGSRKKKPRIPRSHITVTIGSLSNGALDIKVEGIKRTMMKPWCCNRRKHSLAVADFLDSAMMDRMQKTAKVEVVIFKNHLR